MARSAGQILLLGGSDGVQHLGKQGVIIEILQDHGHGSAFGVYVHLAKELQPGQGGQVLLSGVRKHVRRGP